MVATGLAALVFSWAPPIWVGQCWWPLSQGRCGGSVVEGAVGWGVSIHSLAAFSPKTLARSVGSVCASPKSSARSNWTCFCTRPKGEYSGTGLCGEGGFLQHAWKCHLSTPYFWSPAARGEDENHSRSSLAACLWAAGMEGLGRVRCTYLVCWGSPRTWIWWWGTLMPLQITPVESAPMWRMGMLVPGSWSSCRQDLP